MGKNTFFQFTRGFLIASLLLFAARAFSDSADEFASDHSNEREMVQALEAYAVYKMGQYDDAFKRFHALAEKGNVQGMLNVANMYAAGVGTRENQVSATQWYQHAAEKGSAIAMEEFAMRLRQGLGIVKDVKAAAKWRERVNSQAPARLKTAALEEIDIAATTPAIEEQLAQLDAAAQEKSASGVVKWIDSSSRLLAVLPGTRQWTVLDKAQLAALWQAGFDRTGSYHYRRGGAAHKDSEDGFIHTHFVIHEEWHTGEESASPVPPVRVQITNDLLITMIGDTPKIHQWKLQVRQSGK